MTPIVLKNAILVDLSPPRIRRGNLRVEDGLIAAVGPEVVPAPGDEVHECGGAVVLPGLVNGHTHLYSALAVGMPPPADPPSNFLEILERVWWKLDLALDSRAVAASALLGAIEALRCGTTTLIDHHASPNCIGGSLELIEGALERVGLRGVLCYEVTDRNGAAGRDEGIQENERYLERCSRRDHGRFAGLVGGHALFTLEDATLDALAEVSQTWDVGVHLHLAEDHCDGEVCETEHQVFLLDRLKSHRLLRPAAVFAHGTHLTEDDVGTLAGAGCTVVHNARSNMNNSVGYAPTAAMLGSIPVSLGSDGIGSDMLAEARAAFFKAHDEQIALSPDHVLTMLAQSAVRAEQSLDVALGRIDAQAAADLVVTDYLPATPMTDDNVGGHLLFGLNSRHVKDVMIAGQWRLRDRNLVGLDEAAERAGAAVIAADLWGRM